MDTSDADIKHFTGQGQISNKVKIQLISFIYWFFYYLLWSPFNLLPSLHIFKAVWSQNTIIFIKYILVQYNNKIFW